MPLEITLQYLDAGGWVMKGHLAISSVHYSAIVIRGNILIVTATVTNIIYIRLHL